MSQKLLKKSCWLVLMSLVKPTHELGEANTRGGTAAFLSDGRAVSFLVFGKKPLVREVWQKAEANGHTIPTPGHKQADWEQEKLSFLLGASGL
jgi:hypothetical protein